MPGQFSKSARPRRPGAYTNFEVVERPTILTSAGSIVALAVTHDWGPGEVATAVGNAGEFDAVFGTADTSGRRAVRAAFRGEDVPGFGGAGGVIVWRMLGTGAAKAAVTLTNTTTATPALTLTARYEGTRGNTLRATVQDNAANTANTDLIIKLGTVEVERYTFADTDITNAAAQINAESDWVTATVLVTGTALTVVADAPFTAGNDGATITGTEITDMQAGLEVERFGVFAMDDIQGKTYSGTTAAATITSLKAWAVGTADAPGLNRSGKRVMVVVGGVAGENVTTANTRSASLNDENFVNVGVGTYRDSADNRNVSTSELAPRVAGVLAQRGEAMSLSFARLGGLTIVAGPTNANILSAFDSGTVVLARDSAATPVRIEKGLTTYSTKTDTAKPYLIYRNPQFVRVMQILEMELTEHAEASVIGKVLINDQTRRAVVAEVGARLRRREALGIVQPGSTVAIDQDPPPTPEDEFVALVIGLKFGRSIEQIFFSIRVG